MTDPDFFRKPEPKTLAEIAAITGADLVRGGGEAVISDIAPLDLAEAGMLTFLDNLKYLKSLETTSATACVCSPTAIDKIPDSVIPLVAKQPYHCYAAIVATFYPQAAQPNGVWDDSGIHPQAHIHISAKIEESVRIEPGAVIGPGVHIGKGTVISANAAIGANVHIGRQCSIGTNTSLSHCLLGDGVIIHPGAAIGQDGFGFAMGPQGHIKVGQVGRVIIQDNVEIGANTTIDRGANRDTVIGEGTKIDNQVQIGHNVEIGRHCVIVGQAGIAGSAKLDDFVVVAGKAGVAGHLHIGAGAQIAGASNVAHNVPVGERWAGTPARPFRQFIRELTRLKSLAQVPNKK